MKKARYFHCLGFWFLDQEKINCGQLSMSCWKNFLEDRTTETVKSIQKNVIIWHMMRSENSWEECTFLHWGRPRLRYDEKKEIIQSTHRWLTLSDIHKFIDWKGGVLLFLFNLTHKDTHCFLCLKNRFLLISFCFKHTIDLKPGSKWENWFAGTT